MLLEKPLSEQIVVNGKYITTYTSVLFVVCVCVCTSVCVCECVCVCVCEREREVYANHYHR